MDPGDAGYRDAMTNIINGSFTRGEDGKLVLHVESPMLVEARARTTSSGTGEWHEGDPFKHTHKHVSTHIHTHALPEHRTHTCLQASCTTHITLEHDTYIAFWSCSNASSHVAMPPPHPHTHILEHTTNIHFQLLDTATHTRRLRFLYVHVLVRTSRFFVLASCVLPRGSIF